MSRNIIVGLAVLVVAVLAWIVIDRMSEGEVPEMVEGVPQVEVDPETVVEEELTPTVDPVEGVGRDIVGDVVEVTPEPGEEAALLPETGAEVLGDTTEGPTVGASPLVEAGPSTTEDAVELTGETVVDPGTPAIVVEEEPAEEAAAGAALVEEAPAEDGATELVIIDGAPGEEAPAEGTEAETVVIEDATAEEAPATGTATEPVVIEGATADEAPAEDGATELVVIEGAPDAADAGTDTVDIPRDEAALAEMLTPETFDADAILAYVENDQELDAVQRNALVTALEQARDNPEFVDAAILALRRQFEIE
ncbi:hypothetical protein [Jannaschia formosa]|uniref:hypothetical protein n=1 Tax=Jannaschia formosa TaxID=2259592 RepID=UPI000E1B9C8E|nr:hypothetical protein [Jannaschia formosa]TFL17976.1 hypothetical protein DR046_12520 [Jannaschia formosa]